MGYCVSISIDRVRITPEQVKNCLAAINKMHTGQDAYKFSWVTGKVCKTLKDAFHEWRYDAVANEEKGGITVEYFIGEKWGDAALLFQTIAPFVAGDEGSIEVRGEDGEQWRYCFVNGTLKEERRSQEWVDDVSASGCFPRYLSACIEPITVKSLKVLLRDLPEDMIVVGRDGHSGEIDNLTVSVDEDNHDEPTLEFTTG